MNEVPAGFVDEAPVPGGFVDEPAAPTSAGDIVKDVGFSTAIGVPKGVIGMAGLPGEVAGLAAKGAGWLTGTDPETWRDPEKTQPAAYPSVFAESAAGRIRADTVSIRANSPPAPSRP